MINLKPHSFTDKPVSFTLGVSPLEASIDQKRNVIELLPGYQTFVTVTPQLVDTSDAFNSFSVETRKCKFVHETDEMPLNLLNSYTRVGCEFECAAERAALLCKCMPWYYTNENYTRTPICDMFGGYCFEQIMSNDQYYKMCPEICLDDCKGMFMSVTSSYLAINTDEVCKEGSFLDQLFQKSSRQIFPFEHYNKMVNESKNTNDIETQISNLKINLNEDIEEIEENHDDLETQIMIYTSKLENILNEVNEVIVQKLNEDIVQKLNEDIVQKLNEEIVQKLIIQLSKIVKLELDPNEYQLHNIPIIEGHIIDNIDLPVFQQKQRQKQKVENKQTEAELTSMTGENKEWRKNLCKKFVEKYVVLVNVESSTNSVAYTIRDMRDSSIEKLGIIAGNIGLFTGLSILSFVDMAFFLYSSYSNFRNKRKNTVNEEESFQNSENVQAIGDEECTDSSSDLHNMLIRLKRQETMVEKVYYR